MVLSSKQKARRRMHYEKKKRLYGLLFCLPWLIGFIYFFLLSFGEAVLYSLSNVTFTSDGINLTFIGIKNYVQAFTTNADFLQRLTESISAMIYQLPMILIFSVCLSLILNMKFKGRILVRGIFFLPVIIASGVVMTVINGDAMSSSMMGSSNSSVLFQGIEFGNLLLRMGVPEQVANMLMNAVNNIFSLVWRSGVQTLLLVSGLQSVPTDVYEAAQIEGATAWEIFWKITFPLISPILVLTAFYTMVDLATDSSNSMAALILDTSRKSQLSDSSMYSLIWCVVVLLISGILYLICRKHIHYMDERG